MSIITAAEYAYVMHTVSNYAPKAVIVNDDNRAAITFTANNKITDINIFLIMHFLKISARAGRKVVPIDTGVIADEYSRLLCDVLQACGRKVFIKFGDKNNVTTNIFGCVVITTTSKY